jgi:hypothetical protein
VQLDLATLVSITQTLTLHGRALIHWRFCEMLQASFQRSVGALEMLIAVLCVKNHALPHIAMQ